MRRSSSRLKHSLLWPNKTAEDNMNTEKTVNPENDFIDNMNELCVKTPERTTLAKSVQPLNSNQDIIQKKTLSFFDTSLEGSENEENILTIDAPIVTPTKLLRNTIIYVDVRAENENRSKAISRELERLGATIAEKLGSYVTHVVFKDGRNSTLNQLKKYPHIHAVSVLWVDACKTSNYQVNEELFPAKLLGSNIGQDLPIAKVKRLKSLQPKTFEEDVTNSGKKEDRRKKKLKKKDKNYGTPLDQIICLNSQDYIKSADLHKFVATPLAIPDTPWIVNYINGSTKDTISPNEYESDSTDLSQDVQCKLTFGKTSPGKRSSCLVALGSSPSEKDEANIPKTADTIIIVPDENDLRRDEPSPLKRRSTEQGEGSDIIDCVDLTQKQDSSHNNDCATVPDNPMKKKKKLLSKSRLNIPQEKLISPALKDSDGQKKNKRVEKQPINDKKQRRFDTSVNQRCLPNAYTLLKQLDNSKMVRKTNQQKPGISEKLAMEIQNLQKTSANAQSDRSNKNMLNDGLNEITLSELNENEQNDGLNEVLSHEIPQCISPINQRRRSKRISDKCSENVHFQVSETNDTNIPGAMDIQNTQDDDEIYVVDGIDPNVSFVHDETEGLVCTSQTDKSAFKLDVSDESLHKDKQDKTVDTTTTDIASKTCSTGVSIIFNSDSEISDSEKIPESKETTNLPDLPIKCATSNKDTPKEKRCEPRKKQQFSSLGMNSTLSKRPKHSIVFTSLHFGEQDFAKNVLKQLGGFKLKKIVAADTSHVVSGESRRTLNILHGIIKGIWIVSPKWVSDSLDEGCWLDEENYEMSEEFRSAKVSRLNRIQNGQSSHVTLFAKLPRIYLAEVTSPSHEEMMSLITSCGGKLTNSIRKAGIAIGMIKSRRNDLRIVSEKWILDSITNGRIMPTKSYEYRVPLFRERSPDF